MMLQCGTCELANNLSRGMQNYFECNNFKRSKILICAETDKMLLLNSRSSESIKGQIAVDAFYVSF